MKKNLFKKIVAVVMSLTMVLGSATLTFARQENGANVVPTENRWESFSICTREDGGVWEDALKGIRSDAFPEGQTKGKDYATEGYITETNYTSSSFNFYVKNTGWDGEYNDITGDLVADNPWGMTAKMTGIPVEHNRYYTISFKIKSTLTGTYTVKDENDQPVLDEAGNEVKADSTTKHLTFGITDSKTGTAVEIITAEGATTGGMIELDTSKDEWLTVTALIKIGDSRAFKADNMTVTFALGSRIVNYPQEIAQSGYVYLSDFSVIAGNQYLVTYKGDAETKTEYVNEGEMADGSVVVGKKGYTLTGYKNAATGSAHNFATPITSDTTLVAQYAKTAKPAKAKISKVKPAKKKVTVTYKKIKGAVGYEVKYSYKKNMKKATTVSTTKAKQKIKKLKSGKMVFVQVRAYVLDSSGNKVFGKWSAKKKGYVK